jgi:hypothetical protein
MGDKIYQLNTLQILKIPEVGWHENWNVIFFNKIYPII